MEIRPCKNCGYIEKPTGSFSYAQFSIFWNLYPRKVGKGAAEKVWSKLKGDEAMFQKILEAVENQKTGESWKKERGIYIPHPSTWLNQKRWEDEPVVKWVDPYKKPPIEPQKLESVKKHLEDIKEREYRRLEAIRLAKMNIPPEDAPNPL